MTCLFVETAIFLCASGLLAFLWRGRSDPVLKKALGAAFAVGTTCSILLEIVNERWFAGQGAVYPCAVLPLWPFEFPIAIVLMTGLYAALIAYAACRVADATPLSRFGTRLVLAITAAAVLNLLSIAVEHAGVAAGYWRHLRATELSRIYPFVYLFYAAASLPATVVFFVVRYRQEHP
ncbi:MAG TPA: hypothetical protein P5077_08260 [bacterium]|nr:hypothetical protein [bacterium]